MASQLVTVRLFNNGMRLRLDPSAPFEEILQAAEQRFREGSSFFKDAALSVTFEGRTLTEEEEDSLVDAVMDNSSVRILCICREDLITDTMFARAVRRIRGLPEITPVDPDLTSFKVVRRNIESGEVIEARQDLLVLGNAAENSVLVSQGSIIVLGDLLGQVIAGQGKEYAAADGAEADTDGVSGSVFVHASGFAPEKLRICGLRYRGQLPSAKALGFLSRLQPRTASVRNGVVIIEQPDKGYLNV